MRLKPGIDAVWVVKEGDGSHVPVDARVVHAVCGFASPEPFAAGSCGEPPSIGEALSGGRVVGGRVMPCARGHDQEV